jgi:hypothetical protein
MHTASRTFLAGRVCRTILVAIPLTLIACQAENTDGLPPDAVDDQASVQPSLEASEFARQAELRALADEQYDTIREWLRRNGLHQRNHAELVSLAETDSAATRYIDCHDSSSTPSGTDTRLGLLSTCLTGETSKKLPEETPSPMIAIADESTPGL